MALLYLYTLCFWMTPYILECYVVVTGPNGIITSPGFPYYNYRDNIRCEWLIKLHNGQSIKINFFAFHVGNTLETLEACRYIIVLVMQCITIAYLIRKLWWKFIQTPNWLSQDSKTGWLKILHGQILYIKCLTNELCFFFPFGI